MSDQLDGLNDQPKQVAIALLVRGACWLVIGLLMALNLTSAFVTNGEHSESNHRFTTDVQLRIALGTYELGRRSGQPADEATGDERLLGSPQRQGALALRQALVAEVIHGPEIARTYLPSDDDAEVGEEAAWLNALWAQEEAPLVPVHFAERATWSAGLVAGEQAREQCLRSAATLAGLLSGVILLLIVALITGVVLLVFVVTKWRQGAFRIRTPPAGHVHGMAWLLAFIVYLLGFLAYGQVVSLFVEGPLRLFLFWGFLIFLVVPLQVLRWLGVAPSSIAPSIGLTCPTTWWREMGAGCVGYVAGLPILAAGFVASSWLENIAPISHPVAEVLQNGAPLMTTIGLAAMAALFAPLVEETFFRGVLLNHLRGRWSTLIAVVISSVVFAGIHPQGLAGIPVLTAMGMVLAGIRLWRNSLVASMAAHALHNGILVGALIVISRLA